MNKEPRKSRINTTENQLSQGGKSSWKGLSMISLAALSTFVASNLDAAPQVIEKSNKPNRTAAVWSNKATIKNTANEKARTAVNKTETGVSNVWTKANVELTSRDWYVHKRIIKGWRFVNTGKVDLRQGSHTWFLTWKKAIATNPITWKKVTLPEFSNWKETFYIWPTSFKPTWNPSWAEPERAPLREFWTAGSATWNFEEDNVGPRRVIPSETSSCNPVTYINSHDPESSDSRTQYDEILETLNRDSNKRMRFNTVNQMENGPEKDRQLKDLFNDILWKLASARKTLTSFWLEHPKDQLELIEIADRLEHFMDVFNNTPINSNWWKSEEEIRAGVMNNIKQALSNQPICEIDRILTQFEVPFRSRSGYNARWSGTFAWVDNRGDRTVNIEAMSLESLRNSFSNLSKKWNITLDIWNEQLTQDQLRAKVLTFQSRWELYASQVLTQLQHWMYVNNLMRQDWTKEDILKTATSPEEREDYTKRYERLKNNEQLRDLITASDSLKSATAAFKMELYGWETRYNRWEKPGKIILEMFKFMEHTGHIQELALELSAFHWKMILDAAKNNPSFTTQHNAAAWLAQFIPNRDDKALIWDNNNYEIYDMIKRKAPELLEKRPHPAKEAYTMLRSYQDYVNSGKTTSLMTVGEIARIFNAGLTHSEYIWDEEANGFSKKLDAILVKYQLAEGQQLDDSNAVAEIVNILHEASVKEDKVKNDVFTLWRSVVLGKKWWEIWAYLTKPHYEYNFRWHKFWDPHVWWYYSVYDHKLSLMAGITLKQALLWHDVKFNTKFNGRLGLSASADVMPVVLYNNRYMKLVYTTRVETWTNLGFLKSWITGIASIASWQGWAILAVSSLAWWEISPFSYWIWSNTFGATIAPVVKVINKDQMQPFWWRLLDQNWWMYKNNGAFFKLVKWYMDKTN